MTNSIEYFLLKNHSNIKVVANGKLTGKELLFSRKEMTKEIWSISDYIMDFARIYSKARKITQSIDLTFKDVRLIRSSTNNIEFKIGGKNFRFQEPLDFGLYLRGKWFEEYILLELLPLFAENSIDDLRYSMRIKPSINIKGKFLREIDIVVIVRETIYIIECKTGKFDGLSGNNKEKLTNLGKAIGENIHAIIVITPKFIDYYDKQGVKSSYQNDLVMQLSNILI